MATLEKIRNKAGLLIIVVGVALFAFIIGDFLNSGSTFFRQSYEKVGEVDGEVINIQDYQERVDEMTEVYKMQSQSSSVPEEVMANIRQSVFDSMVQEIIMNETASKLGLTVSPEELFDMVQGENITPMFQQMGMFVNEAGVVDRAQVLNYLKMVNMSNTEIENIPSAEERNYVLQQKFFWLFLEKNMKRDRLEQKYTTLLSNAVSYNKLDARAAFDEAAESSDIAFVMQPYSSIPDSTVTVAQSEIKKLYDQRKESYKQKESKVIKYIAVDVRPSQDDYNEISREMEQVKEEMLTTDDVVGLVNDRSDVPFLNAYVSAASLPAQVRQFIVSAEIGAVDGPVFEDDKYNLYKLLDKTTGPDSLQLSQIVLPRVDGQPMFQQMADSLMTELRKGADFATVARDNSYDQQSAAYGGMIGWVTEAMLVAYFGEDFKDAVFAAPVANQILTVNTQYATHIVKIDSRTANVTKYKVANVEMNVSASSRTHNNLFANLNKFVAENRDASKWDEAAREAGYNVMQATMTAADQNVGTIRNSRQVVRWAFENKKGKVSDIIDCGETFVIAAMQGTIPAGYRRLESVESSLKSELIAQKKGEIIANELASKNLNSLDAYAAAMDSKLDTVRFVSFNTRRISGIGVEPKLNAAVALAPQNQLSQPVAGNNGVYVFEVFNKNQDATEAFDLESQLNSLNAANMYRFGYQAVQSLINKADVKDTRIRFY